MLPRTSLVPLLGLVALASCASTAADATAPKPQSESCTWSRDGICDEPWRCAAGTDSIDCEGSCASGELLADHPACSFRTSPERARVPPENGSGGSGGQTGTWDGTLQARGQSEGTLVDRYFRVHVPASYDPSRPTPVVYMLAGFTVDMYGLEAYTELDRAADLNGFIVVYAQAPFREYGPKIGWVFVWNVYPTDWSPPTWDQNPDLDFIRRLTAHLKSLYNVDRTRVFSTGHSRGAALSVILAFTAPELIAGFGAEMGFIDTNRFAAYMASYKGRKMPGVLVHGVDDPDVAIEEGSDRISEVLTKAGWTRNEDYLYFRLPHVTHQWQPQYDQQLWDFLSSHPLPLAEAAP